jgi:hypothetical protein
MIAVPAMAAPRRRRRRDGMVLPLARKLRLRYDCTAACPPKSVGSVPEAIFRFKGRSRQPVTIQKSQVRAALHPLSHFGSLLNQQLNFVFNNALIEGGGVFSPRGMYPQGTTEYGQRSTARVRATGK